MAYVILFIIGMFLGAAVLLAIGWRRWRRNEDQRRQQELQADRLNESWTEYNAKVDDLREKSEDWKRRRDKAEEQLKQRDEAARAELARRIAEADARLQQRTEETDQELARRIAEWKKQREESEIQLRQRDESASAELARRVAEADARLKQRIEETDCELARKIADVDSRVRERQVSLAQTEENLDAKRLAFEQRIISYKELQDENALLKRDLQNIDINLRKLQLDTDLQRDAQGKLDQRSQDLAARYLKDTVKWVGDSLNSNNFVACKQRIQDAIARCREIGFTISQADEAGYLDDLKKEFELMVRAALEREEQARIKARIREEEQLKREVERELKQLERERLAIQAALEKAVADVKGEHTEEIVRLKARLAEAEAKAERTKSQAEMTKAGNVYVISNIGSFGDSVFKIGMTRRLEPLDRINELGDASVPFPFDVHMMIACNDAPSLENALHRKLHRLRLNKVNPRKEYFRVTLDEIRTIVEQNHGEVKYVADAEALQYRQSMTMSDADADYIEKVFEEGSAKQESIGED